RSSRTSRRNRFSSLRSSSVTGTSPDGRAASTQRRSVSGSMPKSRATFANGSEVERTSRTASALNSALDRLRRALPIVNSSAHFALDQVSTKTTQPHSPSYLGEFWELGVGRYLGVGSCGVVEF